MESRIYYGEYTLSHWIKLILKKNIVLPRYQRHFVWKKMKVINLIKSLDKGEFIPPIIIGSFNMDSENSNIIIDGQQRLTSILLAYLGKFPIENIYNNSMNSFANENDGLDIEDENDNRDNILEWTFNKLTEKGNNKEDILNNINNENYKEINLEIDPKFFDTKYIGFSYLIPSSSDIIEQQNYYSSIFRNINIQGETLLPQESRAALYYLNDSLADYFDPSFINEFSITTIGTSSKIDFVRFLSLLSQYSFDKPTNKNNKIARGYGKKMENYYEEYIYSVVNNSDSDMFYKFTESFPEMNYSSDFEKLESIINSLDLKRTYNSIIDLDIYFFGLIYFILFEKKEIDIDRKDSLKENIEKKIHNIKRRNSRHKNTPSALKYLRERIFSSISIYKNYIK